jgi:hypothetical protein
MRARVAAAARGRQLHKRMPIMHPCTRWAWSRVYCATGWSASVVVKSTFDRTTWRSTEKKSSG